MASGGREDKILFWFGSVWKWGKRGDEYSIYGPEILNKSIFFSIAFFLLNHEDGNIKCEVQWVLSL